MDDITHALVGLTLSRSGFNRWCPYATPILIISSTAADLDIVSAVGGPLRFIDFHRGPTHSLLMVPVLALLSVVLLRLVVRKRLDWRRSFLVALAGAAGHLVLDWSNAYRVRIFWPFSEEWHGGDFVPILDIWIWAILLLALVAPFLARLVSAEIGAKPGSGRGAAVFALCLLLCYGFGRYLLHERAVATLDARLFHQSVPLRTAALPTAANPLRWTGLVEGETFHVICEVNPLRRFDPDGGITYYKPAPSPALEAARKTETFRVFLRFSQFPLWRATPTDVPEDGTRIEAMDLRFGLPPSPRFVATAILDDQHQVLESRFEFDPSGETSTTGR